MSIADRTFRQKVDDALAVLGISPGGTFAGDYALWEEQQLTTVPAGGYTAVSGRITRVINTEVVNEIIGASLLANQITLPAGTYRIKIISPGYRVRNFQIYLRNTTDASNDIIGHSAYSDENGLDQVHCIAWGQITIAAPKVFEVQWEGSFDRAVDGLGRGTPAGFASTEIYTSVEVIKVS